MRQAFSSAAHFGSLRQLAAAEADKANQHFAKVSRRSLQSQLGRHLLQRRMLYARANKAGDLKTALSVARDEAKLQGLYPSAKIVSATPDGDTLVQHTLDVVEAAQALFGTLEKPTRLGQCWLRFFRLDPERDWAAFHRNLLAACLFHDWGKANESMQCALVNKDAPRVFRHEH